MTKALNLINKRFGNLTVLSQSEKIGKNGDRFFIARCDCGGTIEARAWAISSGQRKSCGCLQIQARKNNLEARKYCLDGRTFGRLRVMYATEERGPGGDVLHLCWCTCGNIHKTSGYCLVNGISTSCGCYMREVQRIRMKKKWRYQRSKFIEKIKNGIRNGKRYKS